VQTCPGLIQLSPVHCEAASEALFNQKDLSCDWRTVDSSIGAVFSEVSGPPWLKWILWRHWWVAGITRSQAVLKAHANEGISCWHLTVWGVIVDHFVHSGKTKVHARPTPQYSLCDCVCEHSYAHRCPSLCLWAKSMCATRWLWWWWRCDDLESGHESNGSGWLGCLVWHPFLACICVYVCVCELPETQCCYLLNAEVCKSALQLIVFVVVSLCKILEN